MTSTTNSIYDEKLSLLIDSTIQKNKDKPFVPTYLYIKRHSVTEKLYFGKTEKCLDYLLNKYDGGGTYWVDHINKHGKEHVETIWYCLFLDKELIAEFALSYCYLNNIGVGDTSIWANIQVENGLDGASERSAETKLKISLKSKGKPKSEKHKKSLSIAKMGHKPSKETTAKRVKTRKINNSFLKHHSDETKNKMSIAKKNIPKSTEHKLAMSLAQQKVPKQMCPYCKSFFKPGALAQHHGIKCKLYTNISTSE